MHIPASGGVKDPRVHPSEDLLVQKANDQLPDPTEHSAEVQVSTAVPAGSHTCSLLEVQETDSKFVYNYILFRGTFHDLAPLKLSLSLILLIYPQK